MAHGRPFTKRWKASERRRPMLSATISRRVYDAVQAAAKARGESVSAYVERVLMRALKLKPEPEEDE